MGKVRVYELAKELGVESSQLLAELRSLSEFARSASSTLEPSVVRKYRESYAADGTGPSSVSAEREFPNDPYKPVELRPRDRVPYRREWSPRPTGTKAQAPPLPLLNSVKDAWPEVQQSDEQVHER